MDQTSPVSSIFDTQFAVSILTRPLDQPAQVEWQDYDQGPGRFAIPAGFEAALRIKNIDDDDLIRLVADLESCKALTFLNLAENRKLSDRGVAKITGLDWLTRLNLSSCTISNKALEALLPLKKLTYLNLSYCNRLTDDALRSVKKFPRLAYLDVQGCPKITHAGVRRYEKRGLTIHR